MLLWQKRNNFRMLGINYSRLSKYSKIWLDCIKIGEELRPSLSVNLSILWWLVICIDRTFWFRELRRTSRFLLKIWISIPSSATNLWNRIILLPKYRRKLRLKSKCELCDLKLLSYSSTRKRNSWLIIVDSMLRKTQSLSK